MYLRVSYKKKIGIFFWHPLFCTSGSAAQFEEHFLRKAKVLEKLFLSYPKKYCHLFCSFQKIMFSILELYALYASFAKVKQNQVCLSALLLMHAFNFTKM